MFNPSILKLYYVAGSQDFGGSQPTQQLLTTLESALQAGISCYQFRDKGQYSLAHDPIAQKKLACACLELCRQYHIPMIINDDIGLAQEIGADGVHLGQDDVKNTRQLPDGRIFGLSINSLEEALYWQHHAKIDYFGVGPIFATTSKVDHSAPVGLDFPRILRKHGITKPLVAIGGIKPYHVPALTQAGADGVAVVSAISSAKDVASAVYALLHGE